MAATKRPFGSFTVQETGMELYHLKTFITVAEERHLTRAAGRLHLSQPSVSAHIKALEEELGLSLFIRTPRGMKLSHQGELLKANVKTALQAVEALQHKAAELKGGFAGEIRIGLNIDSHYLKIADLLSVVRREFPGLELHFFQKHSLEALEEIRTGALDAAFVFISPDEAEIEARKLSSFGIVVVGPVRWKKRLLEASLENLADFPWVWTDERCPFSQITQELFRPARRLPEKAVIVDRDTTIRKMVASGAGLCLMVEPEALEASRNNEVVIVTERVTTLDLSIIYLTRRANDPPLRTIAEKVCTVWSRP
jgi:DNA-binding transcriptional LysR family regulator